ncbi:S1 family peptidase [Bacillus solitudinis]|uniref:S1 family peptidase n=1 Tax=Bacillus solitudinis TaxID=2014074 RepID=UPI0012FDE6F6|nr:serine protease [Bacillus solitudinis]
MTEYKDKEPNLDEHEEPRADEFLYEGVDDELKEELDKKKQRRLRFIRIIALAVSVFLVGNVFSIWFNLFNLDSLNLMRTSSELSQEEEIQEYKQAVVTIQTERSKGTGFSVTSTGLIVTNDHVVDGNGPIMVIFPSNERFVGEVILSDEESDIAIVQIDGSELPFLRLSENGAILDERIYVIGNPLLQTQIVNEGTILEKKDSFDVVKISAPIFPGHSGSPVLSNNGEVVAVVYAKTIPSLFTDDESEGLAIPIKIIQDKLNTLKQANE